MTQLFANNAATYLKDPILSTDGVMYVVVDDVLNRFPDILNAQDWFLITLENTETKEFEIVRVTSLNKANGRMNIVRNQEASGAKDFTANAKVQLRVTKGTLEGLRDYADSIASYTHEQKSGAAQWIITHNLGRKPAVTIQEGTWSGGSPDVFTKTAEVEADVSYINPAIPEASDNHIVIDFSEPVIGRAILN